MNRRPSTPSAPTSRRVTLALHGPIGELASALRTLADALDQEQATSTVTYTHGCTSGAWASAGWDDRQPRRPVRGPAHSSRRRGPGGPVPSCARGDLRGAPAEVQAQLGISRARLGGVLTSLAGARKRLPRDVDYPIDRDKDLRRYLIEGVRDACVMRGLGVASGQGKPARRRRGRHPGPVQQPRSGAAPRRWPGGRSTAPPARAAPPAPGCRPAGCQ